MSFLSEKHRDMSFELMYVRPLRCSLQLFEYLANVIQDRWNSMLITSSLSADVVLEIDLMTDHSSSWINRILKFLLFSRMVSVSRWFLQTFWEEILRSLIIIFENHSWLNKLSWLWYLEALVISCCANPSWTNAFRMNMMCY